MDTFSRCSLVLTFTIFEIVVLGSTTPVWSPQSSIGFGRNIRHLPCVSRRSGETGVCMFAFSCAKANGTHLGTCIDRFYFGSCCKLANQNDDLAEPLDSNHIDQDTPILSTESYQLSTYQSVQTVSNKTVSITPSTTTPRTTTEHTTPKPTKKPTTTSKPIDTSAYTHKPVTSTLKPQVTKPNLPQSTVKPRPSSKPTPKPQITSRPKPTNTSSPTKPKPPKPVSSTKPKPSNTTYTRPQKPVNGTVSKPSKPTRPSIHNTTSKPRPQPQKPSSKPTFKPTPKPTQKPNVKPSTSAKPYTKPPLKPVPVVTPPPPTDPDYIKVPVVTKPSSESTTISNDVVQKLTTTSAINSSVDSEEENSNVIHGSASPTTSSTLLVTWTTVDEVPVPPLPKPSATPSSEATNNDTKPVPTTSTTTTTTTTAQTSQTWVQVSVSTPGPTTEPPTPGNTPEVSSTLSPSQKPTTAVDKNTTAATPTTEVTKPAVSTTTTTTTTATGSSPATTTGAPSSSAVPDVSANTTTTSVETNEIATANLNMSDYQDVCGRRLFPQSRIVGGEKATFGKWPWQISLRQWRTSTYLHKCGAALLNENWAITAAHCVENVAPSDLLLRLGEHDLSLEDEPYGYQERRVQIVASHPQFDPRTFEYDLALLRFYEPVTFQPNIIPVCVPQDDTNFVGSTAFVTGWGRLYEDGPLPSVLQEVSVPVINNTVCETMYRAAGYIEHIPEIFICAGWKKGGFDSCEGDSGGPMVIQRPDHRWLLAGVISWGIGCAEPNQPGVYTRISEFRGWINQILQF